MGCRLVCLCTTITVEVLHVRAEPPRQAWFVKSRMFLLWLGVGNVGHSGRERFPKPVMFTPAPKSASLGSLIEHKPCPQFFCLSIKFLVVLAVLPEPPLLHLPS